MQEDVDRQGKKLASSHRTKKICGVTWSILKDYVMTGERNGKKIKVPLNEDQQFLLKRYIEAEKQEKDFISKGLSHKFVQEVFLYFYYAGHGCADHKQIVVLNEQNIDKIFWNVEDKIKT